MSATGSAAEPAAEPAAEASDLSLQQAAAALGVHYMTAYRYVRTGVLDATMSGSQWQVPAAAVAALRAHLHKGPALAGRRGAASASVPRTGSRAGLERRLLAGDEGGVWTVLQQRLAGGADPESLLLDVLAPAMVAIGAQWAAGRISVGAEHRATQVVTRVLGRLGPQFRRRGVRRGTVVIGAPAGEHHGIPVAMAADVLRGVGWEVVDLGSDVPAPSFAEAVATTSRVVAVAVGVTIPGVGADHQVRRIVADIGRLNRELPVIVGGAGIDGPGHADSLGATAWSGADARSVAGVLQGLPVR